MNKIRNGRSRIQAARPEMSRQFEWGIWETLNQLPKRGPVKMRAVKPRRAIIWIVAALILAVLAGPPLAKAVEAWWQGFFSQKVDELTREQSQPESSRIDALQAEQEAYARGYSPQAQAAAGSVRVRLDALIMTAEPEENIGGKISLALAFPGAAADFDPAMLDFMLTVDGQAIPMILTESIRYYRTTGNKVSDFEGGWANIHFAPSGEMICELQFPYAQWDTEEAKQFVLSADIGGETLNLSFTYEPSEAHAAAREEAESMLERQDAYLTKQRRTMEMLASSSVPVGESVQLEQTVITLGELSILDGEMHFAFILRNDSGKRAKLAAMDYGIRTFKIDGLTGANVGSDAQRQEDGSLLMFIQERIVRDPEHLPGESLVFIEFEHLGNEQVTTSNGSYLKYTSVPIVFYYNWEQRTVRLPQDDNEKAQWLLSNDALSEQWPEYTYTMHLFVPQVPVAQTADALTLSLEKIYFTPDMDMTFYLSPEQQEQTVAVSIQMTVSGQTAKTWFAGGGPSSFHIRARTIAHPGEWREPVSVTLDFALSEDHAEGFHFEFTIDPKQIQHLKQF